MGQRSALRTAGERDHPARAPVPRRPGDARAGARDVLGKHRAGRPRRGRRHALAAVARPADRPVTASTAASPTTSSPPPRFCGSYQPDIPGALGLAVRACDVDGIARAGRRGRADRGRRPSCGTRESPSRTAWRRPVHARRHAAAAGRTRDSRHAVIAGARARGGHAARRYGDGVKQLHPVAGRPMLERVVETVAARRTRRPGGGARGARRAGRRGGRARRRPGRVCPDWERRPGGVAAVRAGCARCPGSTRRWWCSATVPVSPARPSRG